MKTYATIEFVTNVINNGRVVKRGIVELLSEDGKCLGLFSVFGFTKTELKDKAYMEADSNLSFKGYALESLRVI